MGNMRLILLKHGESVWNKENKFTGWTDVNLSDKGISEAKEPGADSVCSQPGKDQEVAAKLALPQIAAEQALRLWFFWYTF